MDFSDRQGENLPTFCLFWYYYSTAVSDIILLDNISVTLGEYCFKRKRHMKEFFDGIVARGPLYVTGQVVGVFVILWSIIVYTRRKRDSILVCKLISDAASIVQYLLCGAYTGAALNVVMCGREVVFFNRCKHKWACGRWWLWIFVIVISLMPFVTATQPIFSSFWFVNVLPALGSALAVVGLYNKSPKVTRLYSLVGLCLWLAYVVLVQNWISVVGNVISIVSVIVGLVGDFVENQRNPDNVVKKPVVEQCECPDVSRGNNENK